MRNVLSIMQTVAVWLGMSLAAGLASAAELTVFAAASTKTALDRVAQDWRTLTGHDLRLSYGGSATLARQILAGAPADLFLSANQTWMDVVEDSGALVPGSKTSLLGNTLVVVAHGDHAPIDPSDLPNLLGNDRLAMGLVNAVPAGQYGKAAFEALGVWRDLAPQVAQTDNVRAALALVAAGETPFGVVYLSDAQVSPNVSVVATFDATLHPPITYPLAVIAQADPTLAQEFAAYLRGPDALAHFLELGFTPPAPQ